MFTLKAGQTKGYYLEQLEKLDVPAIPDGYGLTTAYHCLLEVVRCISQLIDGNSSSLETVITGANGKPTIDCAQNISTKERIAKVKAMDEQSRAVHEALLSSSWCGVLAAFSLLLEASTDENVTETILKHLESMVALYGAYGLTASRDAFVAAMCRASLPTGYNVPTLTFKLPDGSESSTPDIPLSDLCASLASGLNHSLSSGLDLTNCSQAGSMTLLSTNSSVLQQQIHQTTNTGSYLNGPPPVDSSEMRQQVVAVGTALPTAHNSPTPPGPVMLTAKNLQCMRAVLTVAHCHGMVLDASWHIILTTLQHLVWILGLKPSAGGSLIAARPGAEAGASTSTLITTAAMSDLPVLSAMLSRLFESSQ